jgi:exopolysaccharide biosynthesis predicted pyruvyltransferase EpsI
MAREQFLGKEQRSPVLADPLRAGYRSKEDPRRLTGSEILMSRINFRGYHFLIVLHKHCFYPVAERPGIVFSEKSFQKVERVDLEAFLKELKKEPGPVLFIPCSGNAGDAMIALATFQLFDRIGLDYECPIDWRRLDPSRRVVICGGGGNLIPLYDRTERAVRWAARRARRLILLPHTVQGNEELLADLGPNVDLICRERVSHRHVKHAVRSAGCHLANDMALSLDMDATLSREPDVSFRPSLWTRRWAYRLVSPARLKTVPSPRKVARGQRLIAARRARLKDGMPAGTLQAFRTDREKTRIPLPVDNLDVARLFSHGTKNPWVSHIASFQLLRYLETFQAVQTDRLHTAIGAALLHKDVRFYSNSYYKNRAVYEFSLQVRFPSVEWAGERGLTLE